MIPNREGRHYLAVKNYLHYYQEQHQSMLVNYLNCLQSFKTKNKLQSHKNVLYVNIKMFVMLCCPLKTQRYYSLITSGNLIKQQILIKILKNRHSNLGTPVQVICLQQQLVVGTEEKFSNFRSLHRRKIGLKPIMNSRKK